MTNPPQQVQSPPPAPDRPEDGHKGTFGTVAIVGGSQAMIGAPALAAGAALRVGCGLARIATAPRQLGAALVIEPSATGIPVELTDPRAADTIENATADDDVLAIGPGMGRGREQCELVEALLRRGRRVVLDADGLNNLADLKDAPVVPRCPLVMTPHPGEFRRLAEPARISLDPTDPDQRPAAAQAMAAAYNAIVVLKGRHTVVADEERCYVNQTGNVALATAGTGDVLTGAIASLIAQGLTPFDAAVLGVYLHGLAADAWTQEFGPSGLTAGDLLGRLPRAMQQHRVQPSG